MLKSIEETHKWFSIEGLESGRVEVRASEYLLSLSEDQQISVLRRNLDDLKSDLVRYEGANLYEGDNKVNKTQLQLLIQVIEGLVSKV